MNTMIKMISIAVSIITIILGVLAISGRAALAAVLVSMCVCFVSWGMFLYTRNKEQ